MPELPEVQTIVLTLRSAVVGKVIRQVRVHRVDILSPAGLDLPGRLVRRSVNAIDRRGKRIIFTLDDGGQFYVHLGMTGRLTLVATAPDAPPPAAHTHIEIDLGAVKLRFSDPRRFGGLWWVDAPGQADAGMGPEPFSLRSAQLARRLAGTTRAIKPALLDQALIAGLGNIYVDESLFAAGIHPLTPAHRLTAAQVIKLNRAIKLTLRRALRQRGSTLRDYRDAAGQPGAFQRMHRVYDRFGKPCRVCGSAIERIVLGGRSTHFCPNCQAAAGPAMGNST